MTASFNNVLFRFDNGTDDDLAVYEYELYEEDDIVSPNTPPYVLKSTATTLRTGAGNSSVFAVPVEGSYIDTENDNIVVQKNFFGRVRSVDTSGNVSTWTSIVKTDPSTPLIDSQYVVSLTADKIKAGEIESAAITLGGANPSETIIQSKTYVTSSGESGWFIDGLGEFSLGGPQGINYNGQSITIGSDVQVTANLAADSISVGSGLTQLNINDGINGGAGGMSLGSGGNNYWYSNGNFRVGGASNYVIWNGSTLSVAGEVTATTGTIGGWSIQPSFIRSSNSSVTLNSNGLLQIGTSATDKATITSTGDFTVIGDGGGAYGIGTASFFGPWYNVKKGSDPNANAPFAQMTYKDFTFFTNTTGGYSVFIGGGNDNNNAFIDVGATGVTDNNSISCSGWFRSTGVTGWYNQTYGGGIYMADTTWIRTYGSKNLYVDAKIRVDGGGNIQELGVDGGGLLVQQGIGIDSNQVEATGALFLNALGGGVRVNGTGTSGYGLTVNGNAAKSSGGTAWATFSDLNLKKDITEYEKGLNEILQLRPVYFKYNGKAGTVLDEDNVGLIAQEVQTIFPKAVEEFQYCTETKPTEDTPVEKYLSFSFNEVQYALINAIKELSSKVDELESRLV